MTAEQRAEWEAEIRSLYDGMVRIVVTPTWAKLIHFETTLPSPSASCSDAYKAAVAVGRSGLWSSIPSTTQTRLPCARHRRAVSADKRTNENLA